MSREVEAALRPPAYDPGLPALYRYTVAAYGGALERILGAPSGSLPLADAAMLQAWFAPEEDIRPWPPQRLHHLWSTSCWPST